MSIEEIEQMEQDNNDERWNEIIRFVTRDRFFSRMVMTLPVSIWSFDGRHNFRRLWLEGRAIPTTPQKSKWPRNIEYFLNGKDFFMNWIWPTALVGGFFLSDLIRFYAYPTWRYGNTISDIFFGTSPNYNEVFGSQMGSDLPNEPSDWYGFVLISLLPSAFGLANLIRHRKKRFLYNAEQDDTLDLESATFSILWHVMSSDERQTLFQHISNLADQDGTLTQHRALSALATIADKLRRHRKVVDERSGLLANAAESTVNTSSHDFEGEEIELAERGNNANSVNQIFNAAVAKLIAVQERQHKPDNVGWLAWLRMKTMVTHQLFTIGYYPYVDNRREHPTSKLKTAGIFLLMSCYELLKNGFLLATRYRYYRFLVDKLIALYEYLHEKHLCEEEGRTYTFFPRTQINECQICPDWNEAYDPTSAQSCFDGLLRSTTSAQDINSKIGVVTGQTQNLTLVNLTQQPWLGWTDTELQTLTTELSKLSSIKVLNASRVDYNVLFPHGTKMQSMSALIQDACVETIDFKNQGMGDLSKNLFNAFKNNRCIQDVFLSGNAIEDEGLRQFTDVVSGTTVTAVDFSNNLITDEGVIYFSNRTVASTIESIAFAQNKIFQKGVDAMGPFMSNNGQLRVIDLSQMNFAGYNFVTFGNGLKNSQVKTVRVAGCSLGDYEIATLTQYSQTLDTLDFSNNYQLTSQGARAMMQNLAGSSVSTVLLSNTPVNNVALHDIGIGLNATSITTVDLSSNQFTDKAFLEFLRLAKLSKLSSIQAANNNFGDAQIAQIADILSQYKQINVVDLSSNNISDAVGAQLVRSLLGKKVRALNLSNNKLGTQTSEAIASLVKKGYLTDLDISQNNFDSQSIKAIGTAMQDSSLKYLSIAGNLQQDDSGVVAMIENFVEDFDNRDLLSRDTPPRDVLRWLNKQVKPKTKLRSLDASRTNSTARVTNMLCNVLAKTEMDPSDVVFDDNPLIPQDANCIRLRRNILGNRTSSAVTRFNLLAPPQTGQNQNSQNPSNMSGLALAVPIVGLIFIFVLIFKYVYPRIIGDSHSIPEQKDSGKNLPGRKF